MSDQYKLCLNLNKVRTEMKRNEMTKQKLGQKIGMKDPHTIAYYFNNPDKIRLNHVTAIAEALGAKKAFAYDEYILRVSSDEELRALVSGHRRGDH